MDKKTTNNLRIGFKRESVDEEMQKQIKRLHDEYEEQNRQERELIEKNDYIKWLEKFTKKHSAFSDNTWLYKREEISEEDYENVCKIDKFFSAIGKYADENYIEASTSLAGRDVSYFVKYNEKIYEIGTVVGQGAVSYCCVTDYCSKTTAVGNSPVINFEEIANPTKEVRIRTALIDNQLEGIDEVFNILSNNKKLNIPIEAIIARSNKAIKKLKER